MLVVLGRVVEVYAKGEWRRTTAIGTVISITPDGDVAAGQTGPGVPGVHAGLAAGVAVLSAAWLA